MTWGIIGYALAAGALGALAAWALATVFRMAGQPERGVWAVGLIAVGALSVAPFLVPLDERAASTAGEQAFFAVEEVRGDLSATSAASERLRALLPTDLGARIPGAGRIWLALSTGLLLLGLGAEAWHRRRTGRLRPARLRGLDVWISRSEGPAICGAIAPRLVLPRRISELGPHEQAVVLTHEAEHLRARDPQLNALAFLIVVAVPWNPFVWWLRRRVARAVESDCDRRALQRRGVAPSAYVDVLLTVASWNLAPPSAPLRLAMGRSAKDLRERVERVLRPTPPRTAGAVAGVLLLGVGAVAPSLADPPRPAEEPRSLAPAGGPAGGVFTARELPPAGVLREMGRPSGVGGPAVSEGAGATARIAEAPAWWSAGPSGAAGPDGPALVLGAPPSDGGSDVAGGRGSFVIRWGDEGGAQAVNAEAVRGTPAFERAAVRWLSTARSGRSEGDAEAVEGPEGTTRVWVATDEDGSWSAAAVAETLYERNGLSGSSDRILALVDTWSRLGGLQGLPTISRMRTGEDAGGTAVLRERR